MIASLPLNMRRHAAEVRAEQVSREFGRAGSKPMNAIRRIVIALQETRR
jgi:hypothetical protein